MALEEQGSAGSCVIETVERLPPPSRPATSPLRRQGRRRPDGRVCKRHDGLQRPQPNRRRPGLFQLLPGPDVRIGLQSLADLHGGYMAMRYSCDARESVVSRSQETSVGGRSDLHGGHDAELERTLGNVVITSDYRMYLNRVKRGLTASFPFSGRPVAKGNLPYFERCIEKVLSFNYHEERFRSIKYHELVNVLAYALPLDVQQAMLVGISNEADCVLGHQFYHLIREVDMPGSSRRCSAWRCAGSPTCSRRSCRPRRLRARRGTPRRARSPATPRRPRGTSGSLC